MKRLFFACIMLTMIHALQAQPGNNIGVIEAKNFINKTNEFIVQARKELIAHHVHSGDFSHVIRHQRFAIQLFQEKNYTKAFYHSVSARYYAHASIKANTGMQAMFISVLSEPEQRIVIEDTGAGVSNPWPGDMAKIEKKNAFFVDLAVHESRRKELDHVGAFVNLDKDYETNDPGIDNL